MQTRAAYSHRAKSLMAAFGRPVPKTNGTELLLVELRAMSERGDMSDPAFRKLLLLTMTDLLHRVISIEASMTRDWTPVIIAGIMAIGTVAAAWLRP